MCGCRLIGLKKCNENCCYKNARDMHSKKSKYKKKHLPFWKQIQSCIVIVTFSSYINTNESKDFVLRAWEHLLFPRDII